MTLAYIKYFCNTNNIVFWSNGSSLSVLGQPLLFKATRIRVITKPSIQIVISLNCMNLISQKCEHSVYYANMNFVLT